MSVVNLAQLVFVYGTLKNGFGNHERYLKEAKLVGKCSIPGVLLHFGGIPGLVEDDVCRVYGEVYEVNWVQLEKLDRLESAPTMYNRRHVKTPMGVAWTYYWTNTVPLTDVTQVVHTGVWRGGHIDKATYKLTKEFFAARPVNEKPGTALISLPSASPLIVPASAAKETISPPPRIVSEPIVGPGLEMM